ncbi:MAG TPA: hypothetical protein VGP90_10565 [Acidimicrobiia bacterium]|nr:hypothetical protein [Acidimicrobiia bacterium]
MGLLKKLFGGGDAPGPPTAGGDTDVSSPARNGGDGDAVTADNVAAAFGAEVVDRTVEIDDGDVVNVVFHLRGGDDPSVSVFVCNHTGRPGMADDDESCWRDLGVARELSGLGDSAFVNEEGTLFARLGDRYTIQILTPKEGPDDGDARRSRALARSILDRLEGD